MNVVLRSIKTINFKNKGNTILAGIKEQQNSTNTAKKSFKREYENKPKMAQAIKKKNQRLQVTAKKPPNLSKDTGTGRKPPGHFQMP